MRRGRGSSGKKIESIRSGREQKIILSIRKYANKNQVAAGALSFWSKEGVCAKFIKGNT